MEVHGISSFADECGLPQRPGKYWWCGFLQNFNWRIFKGVYTNVYQYKNWIIERINEIHPEANYTLATCGKSQKLKWWQKVKNWFENLFSWTWNFWILVLSDDIILTFERFLQIGVSFKIIGVLIGWYRLAIF